MNKPNNKDVANAILDVIQYSGFNCDNYGENTVNYCLKHNLVEGEPLKDIPAVTKYGYDVLNSIIGISSETPKSCDDCPLERETCYDMEEYNCSDGSGITGKPSDACLYHAEQQVCEDCGNSTDKAKMKDIGCDHCNVDGKTWINGMGEKTEITRIDFDGNIEENGDYQDTTQERIYKDLGLVMWHTPGHSMCYWVSDMGGTEITSFETKYECILWIEREKYKQLAVELRNSLNQAVGFALGVVEGGQTEYFDIDSAEIAISKANDIVIEGGTE